MLRNYQYLVINNFIKRLENSGQIQDVNIIYYTKAQMLLSHHFSLDGDLGSKLVLQMKVAD
jgi:hypothetical protein